MDIRSKVEQRRSQLEADARKAKEAKKVLDHTQRVANDAKRVADDRKKFFDNIEKFKRSGESSTVKIEQYVKQEKMLTVLRFLWRRNEFRYGCVIFISSLLIAPVLPVWFLGIFIAGYFLRQGNMMAKLEVQELYSHLYSETEKKSNYYEYNSQYHKLIIDLFIYDRKHAWDKIKLKMQSDPHLSWSLFITSLSFLAVIAIARSGTDLTGRLSTGFEIIAFVTMACTTVLLFPPLFKRLSQKARRRGYGVALLSVAFAGIYMGNIDEALKVKNEQGRNEIENPFGKSDD